MKPQTVISILMSRVRTELQVSDKGGHDPALGVRRALGTNKGWAPRDSTLADDPLLPTALGVPGQYGLPRDVCRSAGLGDLTGRPPVLW